MLRIDDAGFRRQVLDNIRTEDAQKYERILASLRNLRGAAEASEEEDAPADGSLTPSKLREELEAKIKVIMAETNPTAVTALLDELNLTDPTTKALATQIFDELREVQALEVKSIHLQLSESGDISRETGYATTGTATPKESKTDDIMIDEAQDFDPRASALRDKLKTEMPNLYDEVVKALKDPPIKFNDNHTRVPAPRYETGSPTFHEHPHQVTDYVLNNRVPMLHSAQAVVTEFLINADQPAPRFPKFTQDTWDRLEKRAGWIMSELEELIVAIKAQNQLEAIDALTDIDYIAIGGYCALGVVADPFFANTCRANDKKFAEGCGKDATGKHTKPPGWQPPDRDHAIELALQLQGDPEVFKHPCVKPGPSGDMDVTENIIRVATELLPGQTFTKEDVFAYLETRRTFHGSPYSNTVNGLRVSFNAEQEGSKLTNAIHLAAFLHNNGVRLEELTNLFDQAGQLAATCRNDPEGPATMDSIRAHAPLLHRLAASAMNGKQVVLPGGAKVRVAEVDASTNATLTHYDGAQERWSALGDDETRYYVIPESAKRHQLKEGQRVRLNADGVLEHVEE